MLPTSADLDRYAQADSVYKFVCIVMGGLLVYKLPTNHITIVTKRQACAIISAVINSYTIKQKMLPTSADLDRYAQDIRNIK
ncbi:hypothetical protein TSAR_008962 [Trichomalopsis sarcophagae]|uniref:Uncharacterized protein n=1 Tax=Trichomalopsis sarcophagae TaxID=543379 RepID=A0A232EE32_9HYME|nr:hypothetical protein TSAR_008962 [Trichomalopsis sarcophagae]